MRFTIGILLTALLSPLAHAELIDDVNDRGELRIAIETDAPPFSYKENGEWMGFEIELGNMLARELDVNPSFIETDSTDLLTGVESGKYDIALNHISATPELMNQVDVSEPYYSNALTIVRKEEKRPIGPDEHLKGLILSAAQPSQFAEQVQVIPNATHDSKLPAEEEAQVGPKKSLVIPFQKGNPAFAGALDRALDRIKADGRLDALSKKWFSPEPDKKPKP
ncbi:transporter substrate-binding domain-containing protein [Pseudomonas sp. LS1212]|uniref:transporter substrate-binding domain-containing protein n=1 Tax=Pseudomonas sp. LS1212 TaxID=2972478 RepID=UPI00215C5879|nr:transporter substrate-binding domain-containing protein [Pseudomonas sp. LS1212]UVJ43837.1 transporter substrate-binding domain-containing protein [Pseudomonas sp. LS1212]